AKTAFLRFIAPSLPKGAIIAMHEGMKATWSQVWTLGGRFVSVNRQIPVRSRSSNEVYLADTRFMTSDLQERLAKEYHVKAVGPFWGALEPAPSRPIEAFPFAEREPSWWEWYFISGTEPPRDIVLDPYRTWELRSHFGQPADVPTAPPVTLDQKRIAHNIAVA